MKENASSLQDFQMFGTMRLCNADLADWLVVRYSHYLCIIHSIHQPRLWSAGVRFATGLGRQRSWMRTTTGWASQVARCFPGRDCGDSRKGTCWKSSPRWSWMVEIVNKKCIQLIDNYCSFVPDRLHQMLHCSQTICERLAKFKVAWLWLWSLRQLQTSNCGIGMVKWCSSGASMRLCLLLCFSVNKTM